MNIQCLRVLIVEDNAGEARLLRALLEIAGKGSWAFHWVDRLASAMAVLDHCRRKRHRAGGDVDEYVGEYWKYSAVFNQQENSAPGGVVQKIEGRKEGKEESGEDDGKGTNDADVFDVVLLDLNLPDSQGLETLVQLQAAAPSLPTVILTNSKDDALAVEAIRHGAQDYLVKRQLQHSTLIRSICYAIERKRSEEVLKSLNETLEEQVSDRTRALVQTNQRLTREMEHRQTVEARVIVEKQLADVALRAIGDAVIVVDRQRRVQSLNPAAERLCAWTLAQSSGFPCEEVLELDHHEGRQALPNGLRRVLNHGVMVVGRAPVKFINRRQQTFILELSISPISLQRGVIAGAVIVCRDITEHKYLSDNLAWQASHDALTKLANRREFERVLMRSIEEVSNGQTTHAFCYLDVDQFKVINDTSGHVAGDAMLCQIAQSLMGLAPPHSLVARLGGDEFGILLQDCALNHAKAQVHHIIRQINGQFLWGDNLFNISVSAGLVLLDRSIDNVLGVLGMADTAMYASKEDGGNRLNVYHPDDKMMRRRQLDMQWTSKIRQALAANRFCLFSQAIIPLDRTQNYPSQGNKAQTYKPKITEHCAEVLLRLRDESGQLVSPQQFIPAAERYNLMPELDQWVVRSLLDQLTSHLFEKGHAPITGWRYFVNLSGASFNDEAFGDFLVTQLQRPVLNYVDITFEVTETAAIANLNQAVDLIKRVQAVGGTFALDDFGSGMSSLTYLSTLPVDYLKIEGQFVRSVAADSVSRAMVEAICHISNSLGLKTIAEGVEDKDVLQTVGKLSVDYVQGFAVDLPGPLTLPSNKREVASHQFNLVNQNASVRVI
ncbi:MAG: EAL domain-containing protein [Cyanobacteria bacterium P01_C01_bin.89]